MDLAAWIIDDTCLVVFNIDMEEITDDAMELEEISNGFNYSHTDDNEERNPLNRWSNRLNSQCNAEIGDLRYSTRKYMK